MAVIALLPLRSHAQAKPTASGPGGYITAGVGGSGFEADYGKQHLLGPTAYVDVNPTWRVGAEFEGRWLRYHSSQLVTESSYLVGPRVSVLPGRIRPYGKFLIGAGHINLPYNYAQGTFLTYAPGAGVDILLGDHWFVRPVDFEYQIWPKFTYGALHPYGISAGIAFRLTPVVRLPKHARGGR